MPVREQTETIPELRPPADPFAPVAACVEGATRVAKTFFRAVHRPDEFAEDWVARPEIYLSPRQLLFAGTSLIALNWYLRDVFLRGQTAATSAPGSEVVTLLTDFAQPLFATLVVLFSVVGLALAGGIFGLKRNSPARAIRVYAMNTTMALITVPAIAVLDIVGHRYGPSGLVAFAIPKVFFWYLQLRHLARSFQLFYGLPYSRASSAVVAHLAITAALLMISLWGYTALLGWFGGSPDAIHI